MKLLAIETSTHHLSVALHLDGRTLTRAERVDNGGSAHVLPWVHALLAEAELPLAQLDGIAYGAGPGAFTGLRLACGVTQGLAWGADLPVIGVCTLEAVAAAAAAQSGATLSQDTPIFACIDARMGEVYTAQYAPLAENEFCCVVAPTVLPPSLLQVPDACRCVAGDGFAAYPELAALRPDALASIQPDAGWIARLAVPRFARGEGQSAVHAAPLYVRDKVALTTAERLARGGVR